MPVGLLPRVCFWLWFGAAAWVGYARLLQRLPPASVQVILFALTGGCLFAYFRLAAVRNWVNGLDIRALVLLHVSRFVGFYFIALYLRSELPRAFAVPAGIGDIIVAIGAIVVGLWPFEPSARLRAIAIWNVVGLFDILMVVVNAMRINLSAPGELRALTRLPLSLLPTFLVPLIIATHVILFVRVLQPPSRPDRNVN